MATISTGDQRYVIRTRQEINVETLAAAKTLKVTDARIQKLDPGGAGRTVNLYANPAPGEYFNIVNGADAAEDLTVKDSAGSTIGTVSQNEMAQFVATSARVFTLVGIVTIALS